MNKLRIHHSSRQNDEDVARVGPDRRDQALRLGHAGSLQHFVGGRIAPHHEQARGFRPLDAVGFVVHDHELGLVAPELLGDGLPHPAVAADDVVTFEPIHALPHHPSPKHPRELPGDDELYHRAETVEERPYPQHDDHQREHTTAARKLVHFAETDREDGRHRHVERLQEVPPLDQHVADRADDDHDDDHRQNGETRPQLLSHRRFTRLSMVVGLAALDLDGAIQLLGDDAARHLMGKGQRRQRPAHLSRAR